MTVGELLRRISSRELAEWMAYYQLEPWGEERADLRAGIVASTIANVHRDPKRRQRAYEPTDFMPRFGPPRRADWREMKRLVEILNVAFGGEDLRDRG